MLNINEIISQLESLREYSRREKNEPGDIWDKDCEALDYAIQAVIEKREREKSRFIELPCKVGDVVYRISKCENVHMHRDDDYFDGTGAVECPFEGSCEFEDCNDDNTRIFETQIASFYVDDTGHLIAFVDDIGPAIEKSHWGKTVFLTPEEAKQALKEKEAKP